MNRTSPTTDTITLTTLSNGLRLAHMAQACEVEYLGAAVDAGSRDDPDERDGLAHFVEHVLFKGTEHRRSWHIINRMEACGGELNAYTTKETTVVYSVYPSGNFMRAADLIADLLCNSIFPDHELNRERDVVADEICQYRDMPAEAVFDDFEEIIFADSRLAHNILGNEQSLATFDSKTCKEYLISNFTVDRTVIFYAGPVPAERVARALERLFSTMPSGNGAIRRTTPIVQPHFINEVNFGNHQSNTVMGARIPSMHSQSRFAISLLSNIIGGPGMNSLLNVELRERRGLVYSVESTASMLTDCGLFTVFFGCDHNDTARCCKLVNNSLRKIAERGVTERFLKAAKQQYIGQLTLASDIRENSVMSMARSALYRNRIAGRSEVIEHISAITTGNIAREAGNIVDSGLSVLTLR